MSNSISFRTAVEEDIPFLVEAIVQAEKSGTERLSYATIYNLKENQVRVFLTQMLEEEIEGQEICLNQFTIAESETNPVACISTWIEGEHGESSSLKAALLSYFVPIDNLKFALQFKEVLQEIRIDRTAGFLQIESVYTHPEHRGKGIMRRLIHHVTKLNKEKIDKVQLIVDGSNNNAILAYEKMDFHISLELESEHGKAIEILPSNKKCSMILSLDY